MRTCKYVYREKNLLMTLLKCDRIEFIPKLWFSDEDLMQEEDCKYILHSSYPLYMYFEYFFYSFLCLVCFNLISGIL